MCLLHLLRVTRKAGKIKWCLYEQVMVQYEEIWYVSDSILVFYNSTIESTPVYYEIAGKYNIRVHTLPVDQNFMTFKDLFQIF